jgi:hypothetical protein
VFRLTHTTNECLPTIATIANERRSPTDSSDSVRLVVRLVRSIVRHCSILVRDLRPIDDNIEFNVRLRVPTLSNTIDILVDIIEQFVV